MKRIYSILLAGLCAVLASIYIYPIFSGLILLPLDLLVSHIGPWHMAATILLKNSVMGDSILQMFPWKHLTFASLTSGILPLWNPYQFMGVPFMASMKPLVFYPANIFFIFGEIKAWNMLLWIQLFLSVWFTYLFVESMDVEWEYSLLAGIAFAFNSLMVSVLEFGSEGHTLLWLPILLYFVKRFLDSVKPWYIVGIVFAAACSILAGQLQYFAYIALVVGSFAVYYGYVNKKPWQTIVLPFVGIGFGVCITGIQTIPGIVMFEQSYRSVAGGYLMFSSGLLRPYQWLRLLSPDWFGNPATLDLRSGYIETSGYFGIIPLFFALYAVVYQRKNTYVRFFSITAIVALLLSMDGMAQILYFIHIPVITSGYGGRMFSMVLFSGAILSAFGFVSFMQDGSTVRKMRAVIWYVGFVGICFALGIFGARVGSVFGVSVNNIKIQVVGILMFAIAAFGYLQLRKNIPFLKILFILLVLVLTYGDLFRMGYRFLTFSNPKFFYPDTPVTSFVRGDESKNLGREYGLTEPEVETALGVYGTETYNPLFPIRTTRLLQALENKVGTKIESNKYLLERNPRMKYVMDFLGVNLIVASSGENPALSLWHDSLYQGDLTKVYSDADNDVYQNTTAYPRFNLYYSIQAGVSDAQALKIINSQSMDLRTTLLIQEKLSETFIQGTGSAKLISSGLNNLSFHVQTTKPAVFYLSDTYDAGWHATVNGKKATIYHADYNFRAVRVPAGNSTIQFWYMPASFILGGAVSVLGLLATVGYIVGANIINKRKNKSNKTHD
jgi:hypothetical protein